MRYPAPMARTLQFDPPRGVIRWKYVDVRDSDDFAEHGVVGAFATAKTNMGIDFMMRRGFEYPGSTCILSRATLKSLKDSTLVRLEQRWGAFFSDHGGSMNRNEGLYRLPPAPDPITGEPIQSTIKAIGLDRTDLEHTLRSTEYATAFMEEADEIPTDAIDIVQFRMRQQIFHRSKTVQDMCIHLSQVWGVHPDEVYAILLDDERNPVGRDEMPLDHPMPGNTVMKLAWNPTGDNAIWQRMVGMPYPKPNPTPDWVKSNVGIREVRTPPEEWQERGIRLMAGSIVQLPADMDVTNHRRFAAKHDDEKGIIYLVPDPNDDTAPLAIPEDDATLVVQRNCTYVFTWENESRDFRNDENSLLAQNQGLARKFFLGQAPERTGRVFPMYVDDYVENGGHLLRFPGLSALARRGFYIIGGLDKGGRHAHATSLALITPESQTAIVYAEYAKHGVSARDHALDSKQLLLPGAPGVTWGYDPSLDARRYDQDADYKTIHEYEEVLGEGLLFHGIRGDEGFELLQRLLLPREGFIGDEPTPALLVFDNMVHHRQMLQHLTWEMVDKDRDNYLVDVGDALKYMAGMIRMAQAVANASADDIFSPVLAYSPARLD